MDRRTRRHREKTLTRLEAEIEEIKARIWGDRGRRDFTYGFRAFDRRNQCEVCAHRARPGGISGIGSASALGALPLPPPPLPRAAAAVRCGQAGEVVRGRAGLGEPV